MLRFIIFLFLIASSLTPVPAQWQSLEGPSGDATTQVFPLGNKLLLATDNGIYYSIDQGLSWQRPATPLRGTAISGFARLGNATYAYAWPEQRLFRSDDEGVNWVEISATGLPDLDFHGIVATENALFAYFPDLYRSLDNGQHWEPAPMPCPAVYYYTQVQAFADTLYLVAPFCGLYKSIDQGQNWTNIGANLPKPPEIGVVQGNHIMVAYHEQNGWKIRRSANGGVSWTLDAFNFPNIIDHLAIVDQQAYAVAGGALYSSSLTANTWTQLVSANNAGFFNNSGVKTPYKVKIIGQNNYLYTSAWCGLFRSQTNGSGWQEMREGLVNTRVNGLIQTGDDILAMANTGLYKYPASGSAGWQTINNGPAPEAAFLGLSTVGNKVFAGTRFRLWTSADNGDSWFNQAPIFVDYYTKVVAAGNFLVAGSSQGVFRSEDGGQSWQFAGIDMAELVNGMTEFPFIRYLAATQDTVYAAGDAALYRSDDAGLNWLKLANTGGISGLYVDNGRLFRIRQSELERSDDGGLQWAAVPIPFSGPVYTLLLSGNRLITGVKGGIWVADASAQNWQWIQGNFPPESSIETLLAAGDYLYAGTATEGVWRMPMPVVGAGSPSVPESRWQLSPNPVSDQVFICNQEPALDGQYHVCAWSMDGKKLAESAFAGTCASFYTKDWPKGMYLIALRMPDGRTQYLKMLAE